MQGQVPQYSNNQDNSIGTKYHCTTGTTVQDHRHSTVRASTTIQDSQYHSVVTGTTVPGQLQCTKVQLQGKPVPQHNYSGSQCRSTTTREASATVHLKGKPVQQYNYKGSQCHSAPKREASAAVQLQGKPVPQRM